MYDGPTAYPTRSPARPYALEKVRSIDQVGVALEQRDAVHGTWIGDELAVCLVEDDQDRRRGRGP